MSEVNQSEAAAGTTALLACRNEAAEAIRDRNIRPGTKKGYAQKLKRFFIFLLNDSKTAVPELVSEDFRKNPKQKVDLEKHCYFPKAHLQIFEGCIQEFFNTLVAGVSDLIQTIGVTEEKSSDSGAVTAVTASSAAAVESSAAAASSNSSRSAAPLRKRALSNDTIRGYKSAILQLYSRNGESFSPTLNMWFDTLLRGYVCTVAELKSAGVVKLNEGKQPLSAAGYRLLAFKLFSLPNVQQQLLAWPSLVLQWNLMSRSDTVAHICFQHLSWVQDALVLHVPKHKGDPEGKGGKRPIHLYANPSDPLVCPVLALAVLFFSKSFSNQNQIFEGASQEQRFASILRGVLGALNESELAVLGGNVCAEDLGTHSLRKGASTYVLSVTCGPNWIVIYLRAGWSIGKVQERYLNSEAGGDQIAGRILSLLPTTDARLATLPAHFSIDFIRTLSLNAMVDHPNLPKNFMQIVPYLIASIVRHYDFLKENLPNTHPLWHSSLFAGGFMERERLKENLREGIFSNAETKMEASGVPPHLAVVREITERLKITEEKLENQRKILESLPELVGDHIRKNFTVQGVAQVTHRDLDNVVEKMIAFYKTECRVPLPAAPNASAERNDEKNSGWQRWLWRSEGEAQMKFHPVPENWEIPNVSVKEMWMLWHFGNRETCVRPHNEIQRFDFKSKYRLSWSRIRCVMLSLQRFIPTVSEEHTVEVQQTLSREPMSELFDRIWPNYLAAIGRTDEARRNNSVSTVTVYQWLCVSPLYENCKKKRSARR